MRRHVIHASVIENPRAKMAITWCSREVPIARAVEWNSGDVTCGTCLRAIQARERRAAGEWIAEMAEKLPQDLVDQLPVDGATNLDHYIYGAPKTQNPEAPR